MATRLAITLGDPSGIGPEVALKALAAEFPADDTEYVFVGDRALVQRLNEQLQCGLDLSHPRITLYDPGVSFSSGEPTPDLSLNRPTPDPSQEGNQKSGASCPAPLLGGVGGGLSPNGLRPGSPEAARAAVAWLEASAQLCLRDETHGVVTAPVNKEAINRAGIPFVGQTEFFSERAQAGRTVMMLLGHDERGRWLRVALATIHIALRDVPVKLTPDKVLLAIERAAEACELLGLPRRRVAVCGLNPHAGEGGQFGDEESRIIDPAIQQARADGLDVVGPLSGDTVFHHALHGAYDAVVAMYHDQGLAPLKTVAFDTGINWTLGLPFIRTSPDHGTAYDRAGQGTANPSSMISAIRLAKQLALRRR